MGGLDAQELGLGVSYVNLRRPPDPFGAEDNGAALEVGGCHAADQGDIVAARHVGNGDGLARETTSGGVEVRVGVVGLEHVPVGEDVEMRCEEGVVRVAKDVPGMRAARCFFVNSARRWYL